MSKKEKDLYISIDKLNLILKNHESEIGNNISLKKKVETIGALIAFAIAIFGVRDILWLFIPLVVFVVYYVYVEIQFLYRTRKKPFNIDKLREEMEKENKLEEHPHSIVLIKDTFNKHSNRFLVYYDNRWNCKLFINYHTMENEDDNIKNITRHLSQELKVDESNIRGAFSFEELHEKYSPSHKENRWYKHRFYEFRINSFQDRTEQDEFEIDSKKYYWMSIAEMEQDPDIMKNNNDVVGMVKAKI
ncbi:MAG: hypothetical protein K6F99_00015 [Lachnospiraceae bacterium]|nr:hypothetical protein [Lachnospiraceae bacterium]